MSQTPEPETERAVAASEPKSRPLTPLDPHAPHRLPPKTVRLISRRRLVPNGAPKAAALSGSATEDGVELTAGDGSVAYLIVRTAGGLAIQRTQRRPLGTEVIQAVVLASVDEFERWVAADAVRFEHPLVYERLIGVGHELLTTNP